jgi:hypothetical protein
VTTVLEKSRSLSFRVDKKEADSGEVVLSRLTWPGYSSQDAEIVEPVHTYLLSVDISSASEGDIVTLEFTPPGWRLEVVCLFAALIAVLGWMIGGLAVRLRDERRGEYVRGAKVPLDQDVD